MIIKFTIFNNKKENEESSIKVYRIYPATEKQSEHKLKLSSTSFSVIESKLKTMPKIYNRLWLIEDILDCQSPSISVTNNSIIN